MRFFGSAFIAIDSVIPNQEIALLNIYYEEYSAEGDEWLDCNFYGYAGIDAVGYEYKDEIYFLINTNFNIDKYIEENFDPNTTRDIVCDVEGTIEFEPNELFFYKSEPVVIEVMEKNNNGAYTVMTVSDMSKIDYHNSSNFVKSIGLDDVIVKTTVMFNSEVNADYIEGLEEDIGNNLFDNTGSTLALKAWLPSLKELVRWTENEGWLEENAYSIIQCICEESFIVLPNNKYVTLLRNNLDLIDQNYGSINQLFIDFSGCIYGAYDGYYNNGTDQVQVLMCFAVYIWFCKKKRFRNKSLF